MLLNNGNFDLEAIHKAGVRQLCKWRSEWGLAKFRLYISKYQLPEALLKDFYKQYKLGNRGEWGKWITSN